jgi:hypothetical protein
MQPSGNTGNRVSGRIREFLEVKARALEARSRRLAALNPETVGIRPKDRPYAPSKAHFAAANRRLSTIDRDIERRIHFMKQHWRQAPAQMALTYMALVEREIDRARRAFGLFFEVFSQRGSVFAPALAAHDVIASDCYAAIRKSASLIFRGPLLKPISYMEHGYSPATNRRGVALSRLLGEPNPFPIIRIPWDRDNPWQAVYLHEVSHNLQADLGVWTENQQAVRNRLLKGTGDPMVASVYSRWHKEIFADLAAVLLGGPASVWGMMEFLAHPGPRTLTYRPGGAHPTGYLRVLILAHMLERMGFGDEAANVRHVWRGLYRPARGHRIPTRLLESSSRTIPQVVDEIAFQTRRNLAQRALVDVIGFRQEDERRIRQGAATLARGVAPEDLPPRFFVSASRYAIGKGASPPRLAQQVIDFLARMGRGLETEALPMTAA